MSAEPEVTLTDGPVTLRPWRPGDAQAVFAACQDPLMARFLPIPQPYTEADAREFVEIRRRDWDSDDERSFAIVDTATGAVDGAIARHGPHGHRATFGYWLAPEARGRGVATRALRLITDWTLAATDVIRLDLWTDLENDASGRVAERAGFVREGIRRAWDLDRDGRPVDAVFYVLVRVGAGGGSAASGPTSVDGEATGRGRGSQRSAEGRHPGGTTKPMTRKKGRSVGTTIGGILVGFDQQVFRTVPPAVESVHHARPDAPVPTKDGGLLVTLPPEPRDAEARDADEGPIPPGE